MTQNELRTALNKSYDQFVVYLNSLHATEFNRVVNGKWTAGQQLDHIVRSVKPIAQILPNKAFIKENFGTLERSGLSYDKLVASYKKALLGGGKATGKFVPTDIDIAQRTELTTALLDYIKLLIQNLNTYSEEELDQLTISHPLLGKLSIREMLYFSIYHVGHHQQSIQQNIA